ncbi:hypothetical protein JCM10207_005606 [Rhodosporidiobolus poonsookiae]
MRCSSAAAFLALVAAAPSALASLASFRATIPGSLHQCEATNVFIFDSANARPVTLVFVPAAVAPSGTLTLTQALALGPYQVVEGITTPDAAQYNFNLNIAEGESFATLGFLPDGTGKNLNLPRTVQAPLPGAAACNPATAATAAAAAQGRSNNQQTTSVARITRITAVAAATTPVVAAVTTTTPLSISTVSLSSSESSSSSSSDSSSAPVSTASASTGAGNGAAGLAGSLVTVAAAAGVALFGAAL